MRANGRRDGRRRLGGAWWTGTLAKAVVTPLAVGVVSTAAGLHWNADPGGPAIVTARVSTSELISGLERRTRALEVQGRELESLYWSEVRPLERELMQLRDDPELAERIAIALVREGRRAGIDPRLLLAVMTVENPWLDLGVASHVGAVGLMQVMPFHAGAWGCGGDDLTDLDLNVCHGTRILANAIEIYDGDLERALLYYNGCVHGTNTPDCHAYPSWVFRFAGAPWATEEVALLD
jgi:soluble lytic murein transglycosylase-like protein